MMGTRIIFRSSTSSESVVHIRSTNMLRLCVIKIIMVDDLQDVDGSFVLKRVFLQVKAVHLLSDIPTCCSNHSGSAFRNIVKDPAMTAFPNS